MNKFKHFSMSNQLKNHQNKDKEESYMDSQMNLFNNSNVADDKSKGSQSSSASASFVKADIEKNSSSTITDNDSGKEVSGDYSVITSSTASSVNHRKDVTNPIDKARSDVVDWQTSNNKKKLPANILADILRKNFHFVKIRNNNGSDSLYMYDSNKHSEYYGLYSNNKDQLSQIFRLVDPYFSSNTLDNVVLGIKSYTRVINLDDARRKASHLIPVHNGLVNMTSKPRKLIPFSPHYFFTLKIETPYPLVKPKMPVIKTNKSTWTPEKFMKAISNNDATTEKELWQVMLDSVDGNKFRGRAIILEGRARTGKSSFERIICNIIGQSLVASKTIDQLSNRFASADLIGAIVDLGDNLETDVTIPRSSTFHSIVTGDPISIEPKGKKSFTKRMTCTIINSSNGFPDFTDKCGIKRRLLFVPFNHKFKDHGNLIKDDYLSRPDVKQWFLYQALQQPDFNSYYVSPKSQKIMQNYIIGNNPLKQFEVDYFNKWNLDKVPTKFLYYYFEAFADDNNYKVISSASFSRQFRRLISPNYIKKTAKLNEKDCQALNMVHQTSDLKIKKLLPLRPTKSYKCFIKVTK